MASYYRNDFFSKCEDNGGHRVAYNSTLKERKKFMYIDQNKLRSFTTEKEYVQVEYRFSVEKPC